MSAKPKFRVAAGDATGASARPVAMGGLPRTSYAAADPGHPSLAGWMPPIMSADAEWLREASFFAWDEVSTISMEDGYAQSLLAVAGDPPPLTQGDSGVGHAH